MLCFPNCDAKVRFIFECANLFDFFLKKNDAAKRILHCLSELLIYLKKNRQFNCEKIVLVNFNFYFSEICGVFF
jgi:hypothetical protein